MIEKITPQQTEVPSTGTLKIEVFSTLGPIPVPNATVILSYNNEPDNVIENLLTNSSGQTQTITLPAPPLSYSMTPNEPQPYSEYEVRVSAEGYEPVTITGTEILPTQNAILPVYMPPIEVPNEQKQDVNIPDHTLYGEYPPKIPEDEIKPLPDTGEIVLSRVVIPEYIIVHDGVPSDSSAQNYYVTYKDYIKNVACCEIYATWPESCIYANILAIMSFTLNRVYTEWYRNQGYNFTITSSTAYDQKWIYGRNIYENIDYLVDSVFNNFLSRPGVRQPLLTTYCDGNRTTCDGLSQWGSKFLGDDGYSAIEILRYFYGDDIFINSASTVSGVPSSFPGYNLTVGSTGEKVRQIQEQLIRIAQNYPLIPVIVADGIYGPNTENAVRVFQGIFNIPQSGIVDFPTWYEISEIYVGVSRIAEPI